MKILWIACLTAISVNVAAAGFKDETDRFTGVRTVSWTSYAESPAISGLSSTAFLSSSGKIPPLYTINLITAGDHWRYIRCPILAWLIDGKPANFESKYMNSLSGSTTIENFEVTLTRSEFVKLAKAKTIEYKACNDEGFATNSEIEGIRKVAEATN